MSREPNRGSFPGAILLCARECRSLWAGSSGRWLRGLAPWWHGLAWECAWACGRARRPLSPPPLPEGQPVRECVRAPSAALRPHHARGDGGTVEPKPLRVRSMQGAARAPSDSRSFPGRGAGPPWFSQAVCRFVWGFNKAAGVQSWTSTGCRPWSRERRVPGPSACSRGPKGRTGGRPEKRRPT